VPTDLLAGDLAERPTDPMDDDDDDASAPGALAAETQKRT
jgi:hypothetical protein